MNCFAKRFMSFTLILLTLVSLLLSSGFAVTAAKNTVQTTDAVRLRSSAKIEADNTIATLNVSEELTLLKDSSDGWAFVSRKNGTKGYCSVDYLKVPSDSDVTFTGVTTDDVYFRKGASTDYDYIKLLSKGTTFTVADNTNELWVKAKISDKTGYIYREYTALTLKMSVAQDEPVPEDPQTPDWYNSSALDDFLGSTAKPSLSVKADYLYLSEEKITIEERDQYTLTAYTYDPSAVSSVSFKTSDKSIATVSDTGVIKGVSKGMATITATLSGTDKTAVCLVTVTESTKPPVEDELVISKSELEIASGNHYHLTTNLDVNWKTTDTAVVTVNGGIITAKEQGTAIITAYTATQKATCTVTVTKADTEVKINKSTATITAGKTYYNGVTSADAVTWSSSDLSVAKVQNGFITAVSKGTAVITAHNSKGTKTCLVTVKDAEPVRFAYSTPNTAAIGETISLYAVTDTTRKAVKFDVTIGSKITTVNATEKVKDGNTFVWKGTVKIDTSGTFDVVAYSKTDGGWKTCTIAPEDAKTTIFVRKTADKSKETLENRRPTDEAIELIAGFEGYSSSVYFDKIANNIPTIGYGKVIYLGDSFYNDMTKKEAYAYLVQTINEGGFASSVNSYLNKHEIYRNQQHFDSLVSFCYNLGSNILANDSDFKRIFTAATVQTDKNGKDAYCNASNVNLRSGAGTSFEILATLNNGDVLTLVETDPENNWYHVKTKDGVEGYVYSDYVTKGKLVVSDKHYLSKINKDDFTKLILQYHHAGPTCVWGLLYRRVDELDVFYYGEYTRNGSKNINNFDFKCSVDSSTVL